VDHLAGRVALPRHDLRFRTTTFGASPTLTAIESKGRAIASLLHERLGDPARVAVAASARELDRQEHIRDHSARRRSATAARPATRAIDADLLASS
jgi:hypothetical protein